MISLGENWPSPAKINLFLHITGRRSDGYHELQTLFQLLDFGDRLDFEITQDKNIVLKKPLQNVKNEDNLVYKAARLLQDFSGSQQGCQINIDKYLPMGGGIGGGSSNAATTLVALNVLWGLDLDTEALARLGLSLGADVPVFIRGNTAFAEGVGESLFPVDIPPKTYLIVNPGVQVSTAEIFTDPRLPRNTAPIDWNNYNFKSTVNDCEKLVCKKYPVIAKTLQWLLQYAPSRMTGTGASLFAVFEHQEQAQKALAEMPDFCTAFIANGCARSPLLEKLENVRKAFSQANNNTH